MGSPLSCRVGCPTCGTLARFDGGSIVDPLLLLFPGRRCTLASTRLRNRVRTETFTSGSSTFVRSCRCTLAAAWLCNRVRTRALTSGSGSSVRSRGFRWEDSLGTGSAACPSPGRIRRFRLAPFVVGS